MNESELIRFLDEKEQEIERMHHAMSHIFFQQYQQKSRLPEMDDVEAAHARFLEDPALAEVVQQFRGQVSDPLLARRLECWDRTLRDNRITSLPEIREAVKEIGNGILQYQYQVQGQTLDLGAVRAILRGDPDRERRRAAWRSFMALSEALDRPTRALFQMRNDAARLEGYETYAHMVLDGQGLALEQVTAILEELVSASATTYADLLAVGCAMHQIEHVEPWDVRFLLECSSDLPSSRFPASHIASRLEEWGEIYGCQLQKMGISIHLMDIPYNGLCLRVGSHDIRILGNPADGYQTYKTFFHELGHAMHGAHNRAGSPILRREAPIFSEGMAEMLAYTMQEPGLLAHLGCTPQELAVAEKASLGPWFFYLRQRSARALFEYAAYANPGADLDHLYAAYEAHMMGCTLDTTPRWAAEPNAWFCHYPVYWQGYVLADVIASQIHHDLKRRFGPFWQNREAVAYIRAQYWAPGNSIDWQERLRRGTGEALNTRALIADLTGRGGERVGEDI